ncbi:MAG: glycosyltransferase [Bacteroidetes bacterium]|nr:glycosyltransferase [Bacteroidota bacterium]
MKHYGIISLGSIGHLNPLCVLGKELQQRNNKVTFLGMPDIQEKVQNAGINYATIGKDIFPIGSLEKNNKELGVKKGLDGVKYSLNWFRQNTEVIFKEAPDVLKELSVDALIVDQTMPGGTTLADYLGLPYVVTCTGFLLNRESGIPPFFTNWDHNSAIWARVRNHIANSFLLHLAKPFRTFIAEQRKQWGLSISRKQIKRNTNYIYENQLAQISQIPEIFDFSRQQLPDCFHYTGPFVDPSGLEPTSSSSLSFPFEKLNGQPIIYASFGTLQNQRKDYFEIIANACSGLDIQLIISLGGSDMNPSDYNLGNSIVVPFAPHQKLIKKSDIVITHAGLNTVLGALAEGKPMVAIPVTNEQPGIATRIKRSGSGEIIPITKFNVDNLRKAVKKVLKDESFKNNAKKLQAAIKNSGGAQRAADIIEYAMATNKPVLTGSM